MIDMKKSAEDKRKEMEVCSNVMSVDEYPYNLRICLDADQVAKLGISGMDVGKKCSFTAMVEVRSKTKCDKPEGMPDIAMDIQICSMSFEKEKQSAPEIVYGSK